jgi:hypothetical protein
VSHGLREKGCGPLKKKKKEEEKEKKRVSAMG